MSWVLDRLLRYASAQLTSPVHPFEVHEQGATASDPILTPYFFDNAKYHVTNSQNKADFPTKDIHVLNGTLLAAGGDISLHSANGTFPDTMIRFSPAQNITKYLTHERNISVVLAGGKRFHGRAVFIDSPYAKVHELEQMLWYMPGTGGPTAPIVGEVIIGPNPPPPGAGF